MGVKATIWLAAHLAALVYPVAPATLERLAYCESRYHCEAVNGTCVGCWQIDRRYSRLTVAQLKTPLGGALEAARLLTWARRHCGNDGTHWYRTGSCK